MSVFTYRVRDKAGKVLQGQMEAADEKELRKKLDERDYFIIEYSAKRSTKEALNLGIGGSGGVKLVEISIFSWQLYTMLDAGLTLINSLKIIISQSKNENFKSVMSSVCQRVEQGSTFADALKDHPKVFSRLFVHMVNAGEVGGVLDEMLRRLAQYYERQAEISARIKAAMTYPALLLSISLLVIIFLVTAVLPQFAIVFRDIGAPIPLPTQILLSLSVMIKQYWLVALAFLAGLFFLIRLYILTEKGHYAYDRMLLNLPIIGTLIRKTIASQFTQTLSTLLSGGIPILTALEVVTETIGNRVLIRVLKEVSVSVGEGKPLAHHLEQSRIFPEMVVNMIRVGEDTGSLDKMLDKVADFYNKEVNSSIETFTKLIEPILMIIMALIIGFIAVCIFLPMAELMRSLR